jgi:hypothetical protein
VRPLGSKGSRAMIQVRDPVDRMQTRCARFSGGRTRSSVIGVRPSASDWLRCRIPGPRCQIAGTRHLVPGTRRNARLMLRKTRTRGMQDRNGEHRPILHPVSGIPHGRVFRGMSWEFCQGPAFHSQAFGPGCQSQVPGTWNPIPGTESTPRAGYRVPEDRSWDRPPENLPVGSN